MMNYERRMTDKKRPPVFTIGAYHRPLSVVCHKGKGRRKEEDKPITDE